MSRHLYDLEKLMDRFAANALADAVLYHRVIEQRKKFYHIGSVDYRLDEREHIGICPPEGLYEAYRKDYMTMQQSFIYDDSSLPYDKLIDRIHQLEAIFHRTDITPVV